MTNISIKDTGYFTSDRSGQVTGTDSTNLATYRANSGTAVVLNCMRIGRRSGINLADEPNPNSNEPARTHFTSFNNAVYEIHFIINVQDSTERDYLKELILMEKTRGIKLFYADTTSDVIKSLPEIIGRTDTKFHGNEATAGIPVIVGRIRGTQIDEVSTSRKFQISGTITFEEERVVKA